MRGIQMRDEHEGHPAVGRHGAEQLLECVESPLGRADPDDWKRMILAERALGPRSGSAAPAMLGR